MTRPIGLFMTRSGPRCGCQIALQQRPDYSIASSARASRPPSECPFTEVLRTRIDELVSPYGAIPTTHIDAMSRLYKVLLIVEPRLITVAATANARCE
jgi:hypothetical protein